MIKGGMITALITPFDQDGKLDEDSLVSLIKQQVSSGVDGLVISGTTAESPNLSLAEVKRIFEIAKENSPQDFQLILGAGTNSTQGTVDRIKELEALQPSAYLIVVPYYNKPTQAGICAHFKKVAESTDSDIILYDVPGRTVVEINSESIVELSRIKNIIGIKDATGNINKIKELKKSKEIPEDFIFLSGDDGSTCDFMKEGGSGVISVLSHVIPKEFKSCMYGEDSFSKYAKLCDLLFSEPNPTPVKYALMKMGVIADDELRLPLLRVSSTCANKIDEELKALGIL